MTSKAAYRAEQERREHVNEVRRAQASVERRRRVVRVTVWLAALVLIAGAITMMMLTARPESSAAARKAPNFTLTDTSGQTWNLRDLRGKNVLLFFNEGAGCQACLVQMSQIEKDPRFAKAGLTILPIVMNTREQITADMRANGVTTPFLLDDGTVSKAYDRLGKGMHADLPGHSFVLVDKSGVQRWTGEYPSMWLPPDTLLKRLRPYLRQG